MSSATSKSCSRSTGRSIPASPSRAGTTKWTPRKLPSRPSRWPTTVSPATSATRCPVTNSASSVPSSVFQEDNAWKKRRFVFQQEAPELSQSLVVDGEADWLTEIKLTDLREEYFTAASVELDHMVDWLIEHFLAALLEKPTWLKSLIIRDGRRQRDLTELVIGGVVWDANFKVGNYDFGAKCYKLKNIEKDDMVRLVAGGRSEEH